MKYHNWIKTLVPFTSLTLNCHISETVSDFDLIPALRARPKYQLYSGILVVDDYTTTNSMGLHAAKLRLGSLRKFQIQPLGPDCEESCFYQTQKKTSVSSVSGYQTSK